MQQLTKYHCKLQQEEMKTNNCIGVTLKQQQTVAGSGHVSFTLLEGYHITIPSIIIFPIRVEPMRYSTNIISSLRDNNSG